MAKTKKKSADATPAPEHPEIGEKPKVAETPDTKEKAGKQEKPKKPVPQTRIFKGTAGIVTVLLLRLVAGGVFAFSGFAKAIDPWGSVYKFGEYFAAFGFADFEWSLLFLAVSAATVEFMLGVFMILGIYRRFTPAMMLLAMVVMLPLTGYLAITDAVAECGCFGNALVMSNWGTFAKNLVLTPIIVYLCVYNQYVKNVYGFAVQWIVAFLSMAYALVLAFIGYYIQPLIDFRPYPDGTQLVSNEATGEEPEFAFVYEKEGERCTFAIDSLPDSTWTFVDRHEITHSAPAANDAISITTIDGHPADSVLLRTGEQLLLLFPDLKNVGIAYTYLINEMHDYAQSHGVDVAGLTSGDSISVAEWNDLSMASYTLYSIDDSTLKMIARGNPAVVFLRDGRVVWKRTLQSISMDYITRERDMEGIGSDFNRSRWLKVLSIGYFVLLLSLLILNRTHLLVLFSWKRFFGKKKPEKEDKNTAEV